MLIGKILWLFLLIGSSSNMSPNNMLTHSKEPSDGASLPLYLRQRKDANTEADSTATLKIYSKLRKICSICLPSPQIM